MKTPALLVLGYLLAAPALAQETWYLTSRHGECADMTATMRHQLENFPPVTSPEAFIKALKEQGLEAELASPPAKVDGLLIVKVPARDWSLLIIRKDRCSSFSTGPK